MEEVKRLLKEKHIVERERIPIETIIYAVFLYLGGLSLKGVKTRLLGIARSRMLKLTTPIILQKNKE